MRVRALAVALVMLTGCRETATTSSVVSTAPVLPSRVPAPVTTQAPPTASSTSPATTTAEPERGQRLHPTVVGSATGVGALAAYGGTLYVMRVAAGPHPAMSISAIDGRGRSRTAVIRTGDIAEYYHYLAAGPDGVYASTTVIAKFSRLPDEVVRVDPSTLRLTRRVQEQVAEGPFVTPSAVYLQLSPSTLARVDPVTLAVRASYTGLLRGDPAQRADYAPEYLPSYSLTLGEGALWLVHGNAYGGTILRLDPWSLRRLPGRWTMPAGQGGAVVGTPSTVWRLTQHGAVQLLPNGQVSREVALAFPAAIADGDGLLAFTDAVGYQAPVLIAPDGAVRRLETGLGAVQCGWPTADGRTGWLICGSHLERFALPSVRAAAPSPGHYG